MLGNHADVFYNTRMRHTVVQGGNMANQQGMPAPREANGRAVGKVLSLSATRGFMPGLSGDGPALAGLDAKTGIALGAVAVLIGAIFIFRG